MATGAPTTALKPPSGAASPGSAVDDDYEYEEYEEEAGLMPFAIITLVLSVFLLAVEIFTYTAV